MAKCDKDGGGSADWGHPGGESTKLCTPVVNCLVVIVTGLLVTVGGLLITVTVGNRYWPVGNRCW